MSSGGGDAKLFARGKVAELRQELNFGGKKDKNHSAKKIALKKIVANMTMSNNDMVALFPDVVACMDIQSLEIKKMCFLFLVNYARMKPETAVKALPTLEGDMKDSNPLVRALALRTMSYIHVREFVEGTVPHVKHLLKDSDPYVRKTAAFCVAKLYDHDKDLVERSDLIERLNSMLRDDNPTVVASALGSLMDIWERSDAIKLTIDYGNASKMVQILPDCSEWGQTYILEALMSYVPQECAEALLLAERIAPRLSHSNSAVVLTCIRVILYLMNYIKDDKQITALCRKLSPPLVTLLAKGPEIQYLALRNALLILQRRPEVLRNDIRVFFCKYNDPIYVKVTKLELIFMLANEKNINEVLTELREYATEIDVHFVRKSVRAIGKLAIKIEPAAKQCINTLLELVATKVTYIVQEATVVIRNIFRKYPDQYESIISTLCENLDSLDEPEAKAAMIWIIGQYAARIENSDTLLEDFLDTFADEPVEVQLALLTATVKLFIQRPTKGQDLVPKVLKWATEDTDNPDLRDRGYMYWRLLSSDMAAAKEIVMGEKPPITAESEKLDPQTLEEMCLVVGTLATVYLKPVQQVFRTARPRRLADSPALQKSKLPGYTNGFGPDSQKTLSSLGMEVRPADAAVRNIMNGNAANNNSLAAAVSAADEFFAGVGNRQMAAMNVNDGDEGFGGSPTQGTHDMGYVVNQNQPQQMYAPVTGQGANGDLLSFHTAHVLQLKSPNMAPSPSGPNSPDPATPRPDQSPSASIRSQTPNLHAPARPSQLREAHTLSSSPDQGASTPGSSIGGVAGNSNSDAQSPPSVTPTAEQTGPKTPNIADKDKDTASNSPEAQNQPSPPPSREPRHWLGRPPRLTRDVSRESTPLLQRPLEITSERAHEGPCNHGTFSPDTTSRPSSIRSQETTDSARERGFFRSVAAGIAPTNNAKRNTTARLAEEHGLILNKTMYVSPPAFIFEERELLYGDFANMPAIGPEAAGSLLVGSIVSSTTDVGHEDGVAQAQMAGLVTGLAGAIIFIAGLTRLGFLENVLSRPFMRGFISSVGFIILIDQLVEEMGLGAMAKEAGVTHGSSIEKLGFLFSHFHDAHKLTCAVAGGSFLIIMTCREIKRRLQPRYPNVAYIPDRFLVVVLSAVFCYQFAWDERGLKVLGDIKSTTGGNSFPFRWPFRASNMNHIRNSFGTTFVIALLGFFESTVAAKALGGGENKKGNGIQGIQLSANRELIALGFANLVSGCFMALPGFGGYGRSKVNASTGGKTPMSSIFLSLITVICILFLLPYFYFLPRAVLSSMITVVAWSLVEEAPSDIKFFWRIRALPELALMAVIFLSTIFYSLTFGIAIGVGLSLLSVIRHSTRPRIQILGRRPHTNHFENAESHPDDLEFIEGCLIVKIPEPLTFANTGDLKNRLRRLEFYGTTAAHPALPRVRQEYHNRNIIFDIHGVTGLDGSGAQVLVEIVEGYRQRGVRVWFSRGPTEGDVWDLLVRSRIVEMIGGETHYVNDVGDALRLTETIEGLLSDDENESRIEGSG
ncbi:hypothetical protein V498_09658 [Pseudogymnoascus sp. VKM F-4517 (FW-2822)]|nr:hypothetical protein V498_09658 [Pseudogymnoascus sp. VKM F-4517 (FW-2822)]